MKKFKIDKWAIIITLIIVLALSIYIVLLPEQATATLNNLRVFTTSKMGFYFVLITIGIFAVNISLAFSKYGNIKLGKGDPNYKTFSWIAMIFCATMGTSILYWATLEWVYYYTGPPMGLDPQSMAAAEVAVSYSFFHWGIPAWGIYAIGTIPIAYRYYIRQKDGLSLAGGCEGVTGGKPVWNKIINIVFIFGIVSGIIISFGTGIPMLVNNLHNSVGTPDTFIMQVIMVVVVTFIFTLSSYAGLDKGMKFCSDSTTYLFFILLAFVFIFGNPLFQIENTIKSLGLMINNFVPMIFETEPIVKTGFTADWTVFYWAWWITWTPFVGSFIAKISKGRTIREFVLAILGVPTIMSCIWFGIMGGTGLNMELANPGSVIQNGAVDTNSSVFQMLSNLPLSGVISVLVMLSLLVFFLTSADAGVQVVSTMSSRGRENSQKLIKVIWGVILGLLAIMFIVTGGLSAVQSLSFAFSFPFLIIICLMLAGFFKYLKKEEFDK